MTKLSTYQALADGGVDGSEGPTVPLSGRLVPPQEVDVGPGKIRTAPTLPHAQLDAAPLRVCGRGYREVARLLVRRVSYQCVNAVTFKYRSPFVW